jgi:DNA-directed RNA polymerase subunit RPC12/RpoP
VDKLHELWLQATPIEREDFLKLINAQMVEPALAMFTCNNCGQTFDDDTEAVPLYKCADCEGAFATEMSNGGDHECPHCKNPGEKISEFGCPSCKEGVLENTEAESL